MTMQSTVQGRFPLQSDRIMIGQASTMRQGWQWPLPINSVVAVLDQSSASALLRNLSMESYSVGVDSVSGAAGADTIHAAFERQGMLDRLVTHLNGEDEIAGLLEAEASAGATVLLLRVEPEHIPALLNTLHRFRPGFVETNGRWIRSSVASQRAAA
jgi:hypothetical protein